jgi:diguanylate cyclase (GGDEF)-like protein
MSTTYDFGSSTRVEGSHLLTQNSPSGFSGLKPVSTDREYPMGGLDDLGEVDLRLSADVASAMDFAQARESSGGPSARGVGNATDVASSIFSTAGSVASELAAIGLGYLKRSRAATWFGSRRRNASPHNVTRQQLVLRNIELERVSRTDPLTGLPNRRYLDEQLRANFAALRRRGQPFSVLLLDLDNFKSINDSYGHLAGDHVICEFTKRLRRILRADEFAGRWGGEEFLLVLPSTELPAALALADRIRSSIAESPMVIAGDRLVVTLSGGLATARQENESPEQLLERADGNLYRAKRSGRNQIASDW